MHNDTGRLGSIFDQACFIKRGLSGLVSQFLEYNFDSRSVIYLGSFCLMSK